jgi:RimJ/RimL family protein N-acetyltransferase
MPDLLPDDTLRRLTSADERRQFAIVAEDEDADGCCTIGHANFGALDDRHAEIGIVVRDDWQGRRVGTALAVKLLASAEARGFDRFVAYVDFSNAAVQRLLGGVADIVSRRLDGRVWELLFVRRPGVELTDLPLLLPDDRSSAGTSPAARTCP